MQSQQETSGPSQSAVSGSVEDVIASGTTSASPKEDGASSSLTKYKGLRKPRHPGLDASLEQKIDYSNKMSFYEQQKAAGVKETRHRKEKEANPAIA